VEKNLKLKKNPDITPTIYCEATSITGNGYILNLIQKPATAKGDGSPLGSRRETATNGLCINFAALSGTVVATTIGVATYSFSNVDGSQNAFEAR